VYAWQQPNDGAWNLINQQLNLAQILKAWAVLSFADGVTQDIANQFATHMENACRTLGEFYTSHRLHCPCSCHLM
jgi:hypothetical protein